MRVARLAACALGIRAGYVAPRTRLVVRGAAAVGAVFTRRRGQLEAHVKSRAAQKWERTTPAELSALAADALQLEQPRAALDIVESVLASPDAPARFALEPLKRIMADAARRQDLDIGDAAVSVALANPSELLDVHLVSLYVELLAGLEVRRRR